MRLKRKVFCCAVVLGCTILIKVAFNNRWGNWFRKESSQQQQIRTYTLANINKFTSKQEYQRKYTLATIRNIVQERIRKLQNPNNCTAARKLLCWVKVNGCGLGCQLHHVGICFLMAIGTNRTLVLKIKLTNYPTIKSLAEAYLPLSETCTEWSDKKFEATKGIFGNGKVELTKDILVVKRFIKGPFRPYTPFAPNSYPASLKEQLQPLVSEPQIWWLGQVMSFLMRPQPKLQQELEDIKSELVFLHPIVGIQIRRTDKLLLEAEYHTLEEYMIHVKKWFDHYDDVSDVKSTRRVFLATDDVTVMQEAQDKFPTYTFLSLTNNSFFAEKSRRRTGQSFWGIVQDFSLLSQCDHVVCTFSSNIGRLVHELMIGASDDPPRFATSIDVEHYSWGEITMLREVTKNHEPQKPGELQLRVGDILKATECRKTCNGTNSRTGVRGFYPKEKIRTLPLAVSYASMENLFPPN